MAESSAQTGFGLRTAFMVAGLSGALTGLGVMLGLRHQRSETRESRRAVLLTLKGGGGRSLAVANLAVLLADSGRQVLAIDLDMEAPGLGDYLERYVRVYFRSQAEEQAQKGFSGWRHRFGWRDMVARRNRLGDDGLAGLLRTEGLLQQPETKTGAAGGGAGPRLDADGPFCVYRGRSGGASGVGAGAIFLMGPGRHAESLDYMADVLNANWRLRFEDGLQRLTDGLKALLEAWDGVVLIDLRTGLSQLTWHMVGLVLDQLVLVSPATHQGARGIATACDLFSQRQGVPLRSYLAISDLHGAGRLGEGSPETLMRLGLWLLFRTEPEAMRGDFGDRVFHLPRVEGMAGRERLLQEAGGAGSEEGSYGAALLRLAGRLFGDVGDATRGLMPFNVLAAPMMEDVEREVEGRAAPVVVRNMIAALLAIHDAERSAGDLQGGLAADGKLKEPQIVQARARLLQMLRTGGLGSRIDDKVTPITHMGRVRAWRTGWRSPGWASFPRAACCRPTAARKTPFICWGSSGST